MGPFSSKTTPNPSNCGGGNKQIMCTNTFCTECVKMQRGRDVEWTRADCIQNIYYTYQHDVFFPLVAFQTRRLLQPKCHICFIRILNSILIRMPFKVGLVFSHPQDEKGFNWGRIRAAVTSNPELWKNKAMFFCWEPSLHDSMRELSTSKHSSLTPDESERRGQRFGPSRRGRLPNLANKHQPCECQVGTHMYAVVVVFSFSIHSERLQLLYRPTFCCDTSAKGTE